MSCIAAVRDPFENHHDELAVASYREVEVGVMRVVDKGCSLPGEQY